MSVSETKQEAVLEAVDAAAMASGLIGSDAYTEQFRWGDAQERQGDRVIPRAPRF